MAYEYDPITGRNMPDRNDPARVRASSSATPWLLAAAVVAALVALLWIFGGTGNETQGTAPAGAPATGGEVAPMGTAPAIGGDAAPATGGELAPAQPDAAPAPAAPVD